MIRNDEPCTKDALDRWNIAKALGTVIEECETPLVIGLYGTWGCGKTSLMKLVHQHLSSRDKVLPVWFDAWQHQFDENPAVALLHTMVDELGLGEEGKKLLSVIAGAFGAFVLKASTALTITDLRKIGEEYEAERFLVREKQIRLQAHFSELLKKATRNGAVRLAFFIDDLDRCVPDQVLKVLEALKLFLNMHGCVYVLGVDRNALETSIKHRYPNSEVNEVDYLDKIVQLPFVIPLVATKHMESFVSSLLPEELRQNAADLVADLGENPRHVKRFANALALNHELAKPLLGESYDMRTLFSVLMLQYRKPRLFKELTKDPSSIELWRRETDSPELKELGSRLTKALANLGGAQLAPYIYLSEAAAVRSVTFDVVLTDAGPSKVEVIKLMRARLNLDLVDAKNLVESAPAAIATGLQRSQAERWLSEIKATGASAEIR